MAKIRILQRGLWGLTLLMCLSASGRADEIIQPIVAPMQPTTSLATDSKVKAEAKDWNFIVYMCNNNDLYNHGIENFCQMTKVGSCDSTNVLVQMDILDEKEVVRVAIEKDDPQVIEHLIDTPLSYSGTPENLFDFVSWAIKNYDARSQCLVLWNHGSGIKDPEIWKRMFVHLRDGLFVLDPATGRFAINKAFKQEKVVKEMLAVLESERGIAFNTNAQVYLTNDGLKNALEKISKELLKGEKIPVLAMDACHMGMVEVASQIKDTAHYLVASEEAVPGTGFNYKKILSPMTESSFTPKELANHIVKAYENEYSQAYSDFTLSSVNLDYMGDLEKSIDKLSLALIDLISNKEKQAMRELKRIRRRANETTEFLDNDYIDFYHFLKSLSLRAEDYVKDDQSAMFENTPNAWADVKDAANATMYELSQIIESNTVGSNYIDAAGLSIYFPKKSIHDSYYKTIFAQVTHWPKFLEKFLTTKNQIAKPLIVKK